MEKVREKITSTTQKDKKAGNMYELMGQLFPICRSITGDGVRQTLQILQNHIPIEIKEIASGTKAFDWEVPKEWNIKDAYIKDLDGNKVVDFKDNNLHVVNYSIPVNQKMALTELKNHLHSLPDHPDWIPYRTSYYKEDWGFCLTHQQLESLQDDEYEVVIDSSLKKGSLTYGELYLQGELDDEVLISTHTCHPSMCNDNLSGICVATFLAQSLMKEPLRHSYRFLFLPGTIGSISWLALNEKKTDNIKYGLVASLLGDAGNFTYKKSRQGNADIDKIATYVLNNDSKHHEVIDFFPYGYDERQYCSPGFNLPVGSLTRTPFAQFPEYHTSADNMHFVKAEYLEESLNIFKSIVNVIEKNRKYLNRYPKCEPQLGKRGLYDQTGGNNNAVSTQMAFLWLLNFSDGRHSIQDISEKSGYDFNLLCEAAEMLVQSELIEEFIEKKRFSKVFI